MKPDRRITILAWLLTGLCLTGGTGLMLWGLARGGILGYDDLWQPFILHWLLPTTFAIVAALIIGRQPGNRVGWLLMLTAASLAIGGPVLNGGIYLAVRDLSGPPETISLSLLLLLWINGWSWILFIFPIFLIPLNFPTGAPPSPGWHWVNRTALLLWLFFALLTLFLTEVDFPWNDWTAANPIGFISFAAIEAPFLVGWGIGLFTVLLASVASLVGRYRRARVVERQQIKWLLYAGALFAALYIPNFILADFNQDNALVAFLGLLFVLSPLLIPAAIAIAILRYRLWDIDIIVRRTLQYTILTGLLALVYFGSVVLLQRLVEAASGQQSPLAIVLSTLLIAALFSPLRQRVQAAVDRRFFRRKVDPALTLAAFARAARDETDLGALVTSLSCTVQESLEPAMLHLWLPSDGPE